MSIMQSESDYPVVSDPTSGMRLRMIIGPHTGQAGTGSVDVADYANGTLIAQAIEAWLMANVLEGSGVSIDRSVPGQLTITATAGGGSYTDEQVLDLIGSSVIGTTGRVSVTPDDTGNTTTIDVDPVLYARIVALESARSLVQSKETQASGGASNYMNFPSGANYVDTPSATAFNVAGDVGFAVRVKMPASAPAADWCVYARRGADAAHSQFSFFIQPDGQMHATTSINGTTNVATTTTAASPLVFDGNWLWLRQSRESATGQWDFWTGPDTGSDTVLPASWTTFQLNRGNSAGPLWNNAGALSQPLEINGFNNGASTLANAQIGRFLMYGNQLMTGTPIADANAADYVSGTSWTGPSGNVWTLRGTATVVQVGGGATSSTGAKFVLGDTDPNASIPLAHHDIGYFTSVGGLLNNSGSTINDTPEIVVGGVILSTLPAISLLSNAGVYRYEFALTFEISASDGATQVYTWSMKVWNAVTGTFVGSQTSSTVLTEIGGNFAGALLTLTSVPKIELKMTMGGTPGPTIAAGSTNNRLSLQKA